MGLVVCKTVAVGLVAQVLRVIVVVVVLVGPPLRLAELYFPNVLIARQLVERRRINEIMACITVWSRLLLLRKPPIRLGGHHGYKHAGPSSQSSILSTASLFPKCAKKSRSFRSRFAFGASVIADAIMAVLLRLSHLEAFRLCRQLLH